MESPPGCRSQRSITTLPCRPPRIIRSDVALVLPHGECAKKLSSASADGYCSASAHGRSGHRRTPIVASTTRMDVETDGVHSLLRVLARLTCCAKTSADRNEATFRMALAVAGFSASGEIRIEGESARGGAQCIWVMPMSSRLLFARTPHPNEVSGNVGHLERCASLRSGTGDRCRLCRSTP